MSDSMLHLLLATHNQHKRNEIIEILKDMPIKISTLSDLNDDEEVIEDGLSFFENALIKARYYSKKYHMTTLADDSGLCCDHLGGKPGIHSARFSNHGDQSNNEKLLKLMGETNNRNAKFVSSVVLYFQDGTYHHFEGTIEGLIAYSAKGKNGFGYDPLFLLPHLGMTFAELDKNIKNLISHRAIALQKLTRWLYENIDNK
jgi:non-canonical purine NTP pyrophosphatase (RdgB/HAM1 family)